MRTSLILATIATVAMAAPAEAQQVRRSGQWISHGGMSQGGMSQGGMSHGGMSQPGHAPVVNVQTIGNRWGNRAPNANFQQNRNRWGGHTQGRWYAGVDAPGGWNAYRRPARGWQLPRYWAAPSFSVYDYASYGLGQPSPGYNWTRYYDDALLIDENDRVFDSVSGIDWDGGYAGDDYAGASYAPERQDYPPQPYEGRRDDGVGGAIVGGVVGGVAGNLIAGRGNRLAGTLIGAGAGAIVGTAIDRAEDRGRYSSGGHYPPGRAPAYGYPAGSYGYESRGGSADAGYGGAYAQGGHGGQVVYSHPREIVQGEHYRGGYDTRAYAGGVYYNAPGTTTVITVQPSVTTTETVTDYVTEEVSYSPRRTYRAPRKHVYRATPRTCSCQCVRVCR
jgi:Ni/Co efflux regulator RcnB